MLDGAVVRRVQRHGEARSSNRVPAVLDRRAAVLAVNTWLLAILALIGAKVNWGATFVVTKPLLVRVPPLTLASARFAIALLVLSPLLARSGRRPMLNRTTAIMGFTGVFVV